MDYVYLFRSLSAPKQTYVGCASDLKDRLETHNAGGSPHTSKYVPWKRVTYIAFDDRGQAYAFEAYLKTRSGQAFARKRLWSV